MHNEAMASIKGICLAIVNKRLARLGMCASNQSGNDGYDYNLNVKQTSMSMIMVHF